MEKDRKVLAKNDRRKTKKRKKSRKHERKEEIGEGGAHFFALRGHDMS